MKKLSNISPARLIVLGFAAVITLGAIVLMLPISAREGVKVTIVDAFFTSTSAVCVTGLVTVDTYDTFSGFGQTVVALLIQIGGLGITSVGVLIIFLAGKKVTFRERIVVKEAWNLSSVKGVVKIVRAVLIMTLCFESLGAILSFIVFSRDYPFGRAIGTSLFHSIAAFNNSGFDILGGFQNLAPYQENILLNLTTCGLIIFGGLGYVVIMEMLTKRKFRKFSLHSKVVLVMTVSLLVIGTVLIKLAQSDIPWLGAFFFSTSARTAGFSTYALGEFTSASLFVIVLLMFIGASPGSTGGGIKTTTAFVLIKSAYSMATNKHCMGFKRRIPSENVSKAFVIAFLSLMIVLVDILLLCIIDGDRFTFEQLMFEVVSGFSTAGLSTGITPDLSDPSKVILILSMFTGRLGAFTMASLWFNKKMSSVSYSEESITVG